MSCSVTPLPLEKIQGVRCDRCAERALAADRILLAKDRWFDQFPDQTTQFWTVPRPCGRTILSQQIPVRPSITIAPDNRPTPLGSAFRRQVRGEMGSGDDGRAAIEFTLIAINSR